MDSYRVRHISEVEADAMHNRLATHFIAAGLTGDALDEAIAAAFRVSLIAIDTDRDTKAKAEVERQERRTHLSIVA
jgi:hypothetical protein